MLRFCESLKVTSGMHAGRPFVLRPWQREILEAWYRCDADGQRIVRTGLLTMGRKNGKTALVSALALAHLVGPEREPRGQVIAAAASRDQAALVFNEMAAFLEQRQFDALRLSVRRRDKVIECLDTGAEFIALSSDAKTAHGLSPSVAIIDELGQWGTAGRGRDLYDSVTTATGARANPLTLIISTQSPRDDSIMSQLVDDGQKVLDGMVDDPTFAPFIFTVPTDADPFDETVWPLANPALGDFRSLDEMRSFAARAQRIPTDLAAFQAYYLNQRVSAEQTWLPAAEWQACAGTVDLDALRGQPCYGGLDLSSVSDLTSFALFWPKPGALAVWCWVPAERLDDRERIDHVPYRTWAKQGFILATPGKAIDKRHVARTLADLNAQFKPKKIAADRWHLAELEQVLKLDGITLPLEPVGQGFQSFAPSVAAFEERILNRKLTHGAHPTLTWCISNTVVEMDSAGNRKPCKRRSSERIDAAVASIMAVGIAAQTPATRRYDFSKPMLITA